MRLIAICFFVFTAITTMAQERLKKIEKNSSNLKVTIGGVEAKID